MPVHGIGWQNPSVQAVFLMARGHTLSAQRQPSRQRHSPTGQPRSLVTKAPFSCEVEKLQQRKLKMTDMHSHAAARHSGVHRNTSENTGIHPGLLKAWASH
jgi:hypothetical protein